MVIFMSDLTGNVCDTIPTNDTLICFELAGTFSENRPSMSVIAPVLVPTTSTDAPMMGSPASSMTTPLTDVCAKASVMLSHKQHSSAKLFLIKTTF